MSFTDWLFGRTPSTMQESLLTPQQQGLQSNLVGGVQAPLSSGLDYLLQILSGGPEAFSEFEAPIMRQFEQQTIPTISERFAGMGTGGSQSSSGFQQALSQSGKELSESLAQLRAGLKAQALQQLQGLTGQGLAPSQATLYDPGSYGLFGGLLQGLSQGAGKGLGVFAESKLGFLPGASGGMNNTFL